MSEQMIFINVPTTDLPRAKTFYEAIGGAVNPAFTDDKAACIVFSESIFFMVVTREYLQTFTARPIADPRATVGAMFAMTRHSRSEVDAVIDAGVAAGGCEPDGSSQDHGFMYSRQLEDPDGNVLEFLWMDPAAAQSGPPAEANADDAERLAGFGG